MHPLLFLAAPEFLFVSASALLVGLATWLAPVGYEDEDGFHYGHPKPVPVRIDEAP